MELARGVLQDDVEFRFCDMIVCRLFLWWFFLLELWLQDVLFDDFLWVLVAMFWVSLCRAFDHVKPFHGSFASSWKISIALFYVFLPAAIVLDHNDWSNLIYEHSKLWQINLSLFLWTRDSWTFIDKWIWLINCKINFVKVFYYPRVWMSLILDRVTNPYPLMIPY